MIDPIASGALGRGDADLFRSIVDNLVQSDPFLLLVDYQAYIDAQERVSAMWSDQRAYRFSMLRAWEIFVRPLHPRLLRAHSEHRNLHNRQP